MADIFRRRQCHNSLVKHQRIPHQSSREYQLPRGTGNKQSGSVKSKPRHAYYILWWLIEHSGDDDAVSHDDDDDGDDVAFHDRDDGGGDVAVSHDDDSDDVAFHDRERGPPEGEECGESNQDINTHRLRADIVVMQY